MFVVYILFLVLCVLLTQSRVKHKEVFIMIACVVLAFGAGWRSMRWADTDAYVISFTQFTPSIADVTISSKPFGYSEMGFFYLSVLSKSISSNVHIYLAIVAGLSMFFLYKSLRQYSIYPLVGLCAYIARFYLGRNLVQIRSGLAYLIVIWGIKYIQEKKFWHYLLLVWVASLFHYSAWIALPLYFISNWMKIRKWTIVVGLVIAFVIAATMSNVLHAYVTDSLTDMNLATTYVSKEYDKIAKGLANPMIYFQSFLLLSYTFLERRIAPLTPYYRVIRDGYFYSTLILIVFCSFSALSGRTSTMFATLELSIIPSLIFLFNKRNRNIAFAIIGVALIAIMYMNIPAWYH